MLFHPPNKCLRHLSQSLLPLQVYCFISQVDTHHIVVFPVRAKHIIRIPLRSFLVLFNEATEADLSSAERLVCGC